MRALLVAVLVIAFAPTALREGERIAQFRLQPRPGRMYE
jgi:hypothetical protein